MRTPSQYDRRATVTLDGFELRSERGAGTGTDRQRIAILGPYPRTSFSQQLFAELGLMHLIAPYFPACIETNFGVAPQVQDLIAKMYRSEGHAKPVFRVPPYRYITVLRAAKRQERVVVAYSAGKDSLWNLWWSQRKFGPENVLAAHVRNLNRNNGCREFAFTKRQAKTIGFPVRTVRLLNGSKNTGYLTMRSRDMFLMALLVPIALEFGASQIITEGFEEAKRGEPFSGQERYMRCFNRTLQSLGIPVRVTWRNRTEMHVIKDLYRHRRGWMPLVCNCFTTPNYQCSHRRTFLRSHPSFPLYPSQCGVCVKCKITNLARLFYDPAMRRVPPSEIRHFLLNIRQWIRATGATHSDMILGSFMEHFVRACKEYGVKLQPTV
jgi:hypothetical protein